MKLRYDRVALVSTFLALGVVTPIFGQETPDMLTKALDLVRQVESPAGNPPPDAQKISLLIQAIADAQQASNHRLKGHRVLAIQSIRSAIAEIGKGDPTHQAATFLHTADQELSASISLAGGTPAPDDAITPEAPAAAPAPATLTADGYFKKAWAEMHQNNWKDALTDLDQSIKLDATKAEVFMARGSTKMMLKDRAGGMADYDQAIKIDPKNTEAYFYRAQSEEPKAAIADYNQILTLDPKSDRAYKGIATVHWMHQEYDATIAAYDQLIAIDPKDWNAYGLRAMAKAAKGDHDGAIADYGQDIQLEPDDFNAFHNRAQEEADKGDFKSALADYSQAIKLGMNDAYLYRERGGVEKALGDADGALADYNKVIAMDGNKGDAFVNLDEIYADRGDIKLAKRDFDGAIADYNQAVSLKDDNTQEDYLDIWLAQNFQGKKADADAQLSREMANALEFDFWPGKITNFLLGQTSEDDFLKSAASADAKEDALQHAQAWYYAGMKQLLAGNKAAAAEDFKKSLAINARDERTAFLDQAELKAVSP
jgi:tetratricopeptide (TPR) repeat protein